MRDRKGFITNSSCSNFILARKEKLTEEQKDVIINFVLENLLGQKADIEPAKAKEYLENNWLDESNVDDIKQALKKGLSIYTGMVSFEDDGYELAYLLKSLWKELQEADPDSFIEIDTDLRY